MRIDDCRMARRGKGFVDQRGGNEALTPQQIALAEATD